MNLIFGTLVFFVSIWNARAAYCSGKPHPDAQTNNFTTITDAPILVKSVKNAHLYTINNGVDSIPIVHLYGSPYEQGFAHGTLMHDEFLAFFEGAYKYFEDTAAEAITGKLPWFPQELAEEIALKGLDAVLDAEIAVTKKYTGAYFYEEIQGMADAINASYPGDAFKDISRVMLMGELTKGSCSMFGAWGDAIPSNMNLLQLRALDWDMDGPFRDFPQVTVYHPAKQSQGVAFANVGFTGFMGSLNGVNEQRLSTSEIGVSFPDETFGKESRYGVPFTYLLRDILQFDTKLQDSIDRITNAHRTCDLILGVGDGKISDLPFRGIQYSASVANFFTDTDMMPLNETWHPRLHHMVYYGMDWLCPNFSIVLARQLELASGSLTAPVAIHEVTAIEQSGDSLVSYYEYFADHTKDAMYVSFARRHALTAGPLNAYDRPFTKLPLDALFAVTAPAL